MLEKYPSYYINLDRSQFRKDRFQRNPLKKYFSNLVRVSGVDGSKLNVKDLKHCLTERAYDSIAKSFRIDNDNDVGTLGAIGCYLSHVNIWKLFLSTNEPYCNVFEDDAYINEASCKKILEIPLNDFDILLLHRNNSIFSGHKIDDTTKKVNKFFGTFAYSISRSCAIGFLQDAFPIHQQIDAFISNSSKRNYRIYNAFEIEIGHYPSYGFSEVGHWKVHIKKLMMKIIYVLIFVQTILYTTKNPT